MRTQHLVMRSWRSGAGRDGRRGPVRRNGNRAYAACQTRHSLGRNTQHAVLNTIDARLTDITRATLWIERAGMDPAKPVILKVVSNTAGALTLAGSFGSCTVEYPAGDHVRKVAISREGE